METPLTEERCLESMDMTVSWLVTWSFNEAMDWPRPATVWE